MRELLGFFTAFGVMVTGDRAIMGPIVCEKEIIRKLEPMVLNDENGSLGENITLDRREAGHNSYTTSYRTRRNDGSETGHPYYAHASRRCAEVKVRTVKARL